MHIIKDFVIKEIWNARIRLYYDSRDTTSLIHIFFLLFICDAEDSGAGPNGDCVHQVDQMYNILPIPE